MANSIQRLSTAALKAGFTDRDMDARAADHSGRHLTVDELAERERTSPATVRYWVHTGTAPRSFKAGRRRLFRLEDVIAWENARMDAEDDDEPIARLG